MPEPTVKKPKITQEERWNIIANNSNDYRFECHTLIIRPIIDVYDKKTNLKVTGIVEMEKAVHDGQMNSNYAVELFKDTLEETKIAFIAGVKNKNKEQQQKIQQMIPGMKAIEGKKEDETKST